MAKPNEKLAASLDHLKSLQGDQRRVFRSRELTRVHRERLVKNGFLKEVVKGWLITTNPGADEGDTTPWYTSFWEFCARYCDQRFGQRWHLSPEQSMQLHGENNVIPTQVIVYTPKGTNNTINLLYGTSLYDLKQTKEQGPSSEDIVVKDGLRLYSPAAALVKVPEHFFQIYPIEAQVVLASFRGASELLGRLLEGGHSAVASRLVGAFRRIGRHNIADEILATMRAAGYTVREIDPFSPQQQMATLAPGTSPVMGRITALWHSLRPTVLANLPKPPGLPKEPKVYLSFVDEIYKSDAYHSLSIEGYTVTPELIERVRTGNWNPDGNEADRNNLNALAARGYWQAFQRVKATLAKLLKGAEPGKLVRDEHGQWYREMFQPAVAAGLLRPAALAGYRSHPVYIKGSRHVPPRWESVEDAIDTLFGLLEEEKEAFVRAVLGHWMLGYIHPYPDGNGRMARFLMNSQLASAGYPWTVIRVEDRNPYMEALESASSDRDIKPFRDFVASRIQSSMEKTVEAAAAPLRQRTPPRRPPPRAKTKRKNRKNRAA